MSEPERRATDFDRVFAIFAITYLVGTLDPFMAGLRVPDAPSIEGSLAGNVIAQLVGGVVYGTAMWLVLRDRARLVRLLVGSPILMLFLLYATASVAWSQSTGVSVRRLFGMLGCVMVAAYLVMRFRPDTIVRQVAMAYLISAIASFGLILLLPGVGGSLLDHPSGVWGHKNDLGRAMVISAIAAWVVLTARKQHRRSTMVLLLVGSLVLIAASGSAQAMLGAGAALGLIWPLVHLISRRHRRLDRGALIIVLVAVFVIGLLAEYAALPILDAIGRDATLTNRTLIWEIVADLGREHAWLGHGYGAFWTSGAAYIFGDRWQVIDHAHNGYVDVWLDLGYLGLACFCLVLVSALVRAWNEGLREPSSATQFFPVFLSVAIVLNAVGHVFPDHNSVYWMLLAYMALLPPRRRASPAPVAHRPLRFRTETPQDRVQA